MSTESGMVLVPLTTLRNWWERAHTLLAQDMLPYLAAAPASPPTPAVDGWQPIETAPLGSFMAWIPSTNTAWPAHKQNDGKLFSYSHGILNEPDPFDKRTLLATYWMHKPEPPK